jgi:hypothetical protein
MLQKKAYYKLYCLRTRDFKKLRSAQRTWRPYQARDSDFSKWHPHMVLLLSAGVVCVSTIALWPLVWRGCEVRVREQTYLLLLKQVVRNFSQKRA